MTELREAHRELENQYSGLEGDFNGKAERVTILEREIADLKDNNKVKLSGMFAKVLERDMYEAEVKKVKGEVE